MLGLHGRNLYNYAGEYRFTSSLPVAACMASQAKKATVFSDTVSHLSAQIIVQKLPTEFQHLHKDMGKSICSKNALLPVSPSCSKYIIQNGFPATLCPIFALAARNCRYGRGYILANRA